MTVWCHSALPSGGRVKPESVNYTLSRIHINLVGTSGPQTAKDQKLIESHCLFQQLCEQLPRIQKASKVHS
jgi:hypothetical protein